jgi:transposase
MTCLRAGKTPEYQHSGVCLRPVWSFGSHIARFRQAQTGTGFTNVGEIVWTPPRSTGQWQRKDLPTQRIAAIRGVGLLSATAAVATMGDAKAFKSGREFAAWLGLVPRQTGTGGRVRLHGISKRGDKYLRTLFIHGARSVLMDSKSPPEWLSELVKRRPKNVAIVAMANKMVRTIWALLAHERAYQSGYVN